jgi:hypothetical protein
VIADPAPLLPPRARRLLLATLVLACVVGCSNASRPVRPAASAPPGLDAVVTRLADPAVGRMSYQVQWIVSEHGSPVSLVRWCIDPASADTVDGGWRSDPATDTRILTFPWSETHVVAAVAEDANGARSASWSHTFAAIAANRPPVVAIVRPSIGTAYAPVSTHVRVDWSGDDPDSPARLPVRYAYRLFGTKNPDAEFANVPDFVGFGIANPESLASVYGPDFSRWTSVPVDSSSVSLELAGPIGNKYLFAITCVDEHGAWDTLTPGRNMLVLEVVAIGAGNPLTLRRIPAENRR